MEVRDIYIDGKFVYKKKVKICPICGGHKPCTRKTADDECLGHHGLKDILKPW